MTGLSAREQCCPPQSARGQRWREGRQRPTGADGTRHTPAPRRPYAAPTPLKPQLARYGQNLRARPGEGAAIFSLETCGDPNGSNGDSRQRLHEPARFTPCASGWRCHQQQPGNDERPFIPPLAVARFIGRPAIELRLLISRTSLPRPENKISISTTSGPPLRGPVPSPPPGTRI